MTSRRFALLTGLLASATFGCGFFDDPTPETVSIRVDGPTGAPVQLHFARNFVAGVTEAGVTQVQVFSADTINTVLPVDTVVGIAVERRFFLQMAPRQADSLGVTVRIAVNDNSRYDQTGLVYSSDPFRWVFLFNQNTTLVIELL